MNSGDEPKRQPQESRAPRSGLQLMAIILGAMALLAVYSNVQKARVHQIEIVTISTPSPPTPSPSPAAAP